MNNVYNLTNTKLSKHVNMKHQLQVDYIGKVVAGSHYVSAQNVVAVVMTKNLNLNQFNASIGIMKMLY